MDAATLTFGIKDVVALVLGAATIVGFYFAMKNTNEKNQDLANSALKKADDFKKEMEDEHTKIRKELGEKEVSLYQKIAEVKLENKENHEKLSSQISIMATDISSISKGVSELTGYIKAKKES